MKLFMLAALLLPTASAAEGPPPAERRAEPSRIPVRTQSALPPSPYTTTPVLGEASSGCLPLARQVAGEDKAPRGTRLDQQPAAKLLFAVDRQVEGCRVVTFVHAGDRAEEQDGR